MNPGACFLSLLLLASAGCASFDNERSTAAPVHSPTIREPAGASVSPARLVVAEPAAADSEILDLLDALVVVFGGATTKPGGQGQVPAVEKTTLQPVPSQ